MLSAIKQNSSERPQNTMRPIHLRLSEQIIQHLEQTANEHGFKGIQSLIRLYIRQGLDKDNKDYQLAKDTAFLEKLRRRGVSQQIIDEALTDTSNSHPSDDGQSV